MSESRTHNNWLGSWRLVFRGSQGPELLDTYDDERRPIGELTVEQAYTRYVLRTDPSIPKDTMQPIVGDLNVELGYKYRSAAVIAESPDDARLHLNPRESRAMPGTRAPHYWLQRDGSQISTLDLFGSSFTFLAAQDGAAWRENILRVAKAATAVAAFKLGGWFVDPSGSSTRPLGRPRLRTVRPDGFVAWRARDGEGAAVKRLREVLSAVLCRH
jgi:hypothetical protein